MSYITWAVVGVLLVCTHTCDSQRCFHKNRFRAIGESFSDGCQECLCLSNNKVWCSPDYCRPAVFCRQPTCPINSWCREQTSGLQYCVCKDGYRFNATAHCVDIDECRSDVCGSSFECVNLPGSYDCAYDGCGKGYLNTGAGNFNIRPGCTDVDECEFHICGPNVNCTNYPGLYRCWCPSGYGYGNSSCVDLDECLTQSPCDGDAICRNFPGTYSCVCNDGFSGNGTHCEDVDECTVLNPCDGNATCKNLPGTHVCVCNDGFSGNGAQCEAASPSGADSASVAIGVVFGCIVIVLVVIFVLFMVRRRKRQKATPSSNPHNNTTSGQLEDPNLYSNNLVKERKILMKQLKQSEQENLPEASGDVYENQPTIIQDGGSSYDTLWKSGGSGQPFPDSAQTGNDDTYNHLNSKTVTSSASTEETTPANLYNHLYSGTKD